MTIPGVDATVALSIVAAVGEFHRCSTPHKLVSYLGLNPRVRQSGGQPAQHGRITKHGRAHARGMLVESAWAASKTPGPLRAFYERVRARRGMQIAAVATARKLAVLCWHLSRQGRGLCVRAPVTDRQEAPRARAACRAAVASRPEGQGRQLLAQGGPPARRSCSPPKASRPTGSWSPTGKRRQSTKHGAGVAAANGARLSRPSQAQAARQDSAPIPALRSGVDHAHTEG